MTISPKKIIIAAEIFPPDIGGPATYTLELARELKKRGFEIEVVCYGERDSEKYDFPIAKISRKIFLPFRYLQYFFTLLKKSRKCDVIYAQGPIASGLPAYLVNNFISKKYIVKVVGDYAWESARNAKIVDLDIDNFQKRKFPGKIGILQYLQSLCVRYASRVIVPSYYLKTIVKGWRVDEKSIEVVYNSYKGEDNIENIIRKEDTLVSIGRLVSWKGFEGLIEIIPDLLKENPNFKLHIYGSGPDKEMLIDSIKKMGMEDVIFIKNLKHPDLMRELSRAGIFVLNTGYEGLSHTILEAMSQGVPIVTTNIGGNPELIEDGVNGILVEYNNKEKLRQAILKLYRDKNLQEKFRKNSKEVLRKFTFEKMIGGTIKILENI